MRRTLSLLVVLILLDAAALLLWRGLDWQMDQPAANAAPLRLEVAPGSSLRSTLLALQQLGALRHARLVELYLRLHWLSARQLMDALGHSGEAAEGRFFPDTYRFAAGTSDRRILERAYERMQAELDSDWSARAPELPLAN